MRSARCHVGRRRGRFVEDNVRTRALNRCHEVVAITPASTRLRRSRGKPRRDDHIVGLFVVEMKAEDGHWFARGTHRTVCAAQNRAWGLLTREGGEVRVRQGTRVVATGVGYAPVDSGGSTETGSPPNPQHQKFAVSKRR